MRAFCLCLLMTLGILSPGFTRAQPDLNLEAEVKRLIGDLDATTRAVRTAAEQRLREIGPRVLPLLPPAELAGPGARESLAKIRFELERRQARESVRPSRVRLVGNRTLDDWLKQIADDTGNRFDPSALPGAVRMQPIEFRETEDTTFWQAVDAVVAKAGARVGTRTPDGALRIIPAAAGDPPVARMSSGAFRGVLSSVSTREGLSEDENLLRMDIRVEAEPRLRPLFLRYAARDVKAGPLTPLSPEGQYEVLLADGTRPARILCDFRWPRSQALTTVDVTGRFHVTVAAGSEAIRFTGLKQLVGKKPLNVARRRGGVTVTLEEVSVRDVAGKDELRVAVRVGYDIGGPAFESHRAWLLHNRVYLELPGGRAFDLNGGLETIAEGDGSQGAAYTFRDLPVPAAEAVFVYVAPTLIIDVPVDVRFEPVGLRR